jgi:hypothetical protein
MSSGHLRPPAPQFASIDYERPGDYLFLATSFVGSRSLDALAHQLGRPTDDATLGAIWLWIRDNLKEVNDSQDYKRRTLTDIRSRGRYIGCADHALIYGSLARACGIPVVWVKSMALDWIRVFRATGNTDGWVGHVFLEVFLGDVWRLVDATQDEIFDHYDRSARILPPDPRTHEERFAYDKGGDPSTLVFSFDWEQWKQQTREFFSTLDSAELSAARRAYTGPGRRLSVLSP